jgi:hypothetical protein
MDTELKMSTRDEARDAVRALVGAWGAELVVKEVAFNLSALERQQVWNWLHDCLPRGSR